MPHINLIAVVAAALSAFAIGGLWYSRILFGPLWMAEAKVQQSDIESRNKALVFGGGFTLTLIGTLVFAMFLGPRPAFVFATAAGFAAGSAWVAGSFGINYLFEGKSFKLWAINGGYHIFQYTVMGAILGLWH